MLQVRYILRMLMQMLLLFPIPGQLVHSKTCPNMSTTYKISQICLSGGKLQVSGPPLWPLSKVFGKCTEVSVGSLRGRVSE